MLLLNIEEKLRRKKNIAYINPIRTGMITVRFTIVSILFFKSVVFCNLFLDTNIRYKLRMKIKKNTIAYDE